MQAGFCYRLNPILLYIFNMKFVLIPVKDLSTANNRLSSVLNQHKRTQLAYIMLEDVFSALASSALADNKVVVTLDKKAEKMALEKGFEVIREEKQEGESSSVDHALHICKLMGAESVFVIPGDAPLITGEDIDFVLEKERDENSVILVPSDDKLGTNGILRKPPDAIPSRFGHNSFNLHAEEAEKRKLPVDVYEVENISIDLDEPADIKKFAALGSGTKTYKELCRLGLIKEKVEKTA